ncbi:MAG: VPLPA-CTERM sorting domain-containing protein [Desulfobaccales bacterium]
MKKLTMWLAIVGFIFSMAGVAGADSYSITAAQVKAVMQDCAAPLSDSTYLWGLWAVRTMPIVTGGGYTITGGSTSQTGWGVSAPNGAFGSSPYTATNSAWFYDIQGGTYNGDPNANPLYMIMDQPASSFTSYFGNTVTAVDDASTFTTNFTLDPGASWNGQFQFVVDGSRYLANANPAPWQTDFFGGYSGDFSYGNNVSTNGGDLACNMGDGYQAPLPGAVWLLGSGLAGLAFFRRRLALLQS